MSGEIHTQSLNTIDKTNTPMQRKEAASIIVIRVSSILPLAPTKIRRNGPPSVLIEIYSGLSPTMRHLLLSGKDFPLKGKQAAADDPEGGDTSNNRTKNKGPVEKQVL